MEGGPSQRYPSRSARIAADIVVMFVFAACLGESGPDLPSAVPALPASVVAPDSAEPPPRTAVPSSAEPTTTEAPPAVSADPVLAKLDSISADLYVLIEPRELVEAVLHTTEPAAAVAVARRGGGRGDVLTRKSAFVVADRDVVRALLESDRVTSAALTEDLSAERPIARTRPRVDVPIAGSPYVGAPITVDTTSGDVREDREAAMLAMLGASIRTIDGRPYRELRVDVACQPDLCQATASGRVAASGDVYDAWAVDAYASQGWVPVVNPSFVQLGGVPRRLARAAEWIARTEPATAARIATFSRISAIRWVGDAPGVIDLTYTAECTAARAADRLVASTGVCVDALVVRVDVGAGRVVDAHTVPSDT